MPYLWQEGRGFGLTVRVGASVGEGGGSSDDSTTLEPHLYGKIELGGNLDDEWLVVHMLQEATRRLYETGQHDLAVTLTDGDGEFLLIEAAAVLPPFLNPSNGANRTWIWRGRVHVVLPGHIVGRTTAPSFLGAGPLRICHGLEAVRSESGDADTDAGDEVNSIISERANPGNLAERFHRARVFVPAEVARALRRQPALVSSIVRAYCGRDPREGMQGLKNARAAFDSSVETRVTFSRHRFAEVRANASLAASEKEIIGHVLPSAVRLPREDRDRAIELGRKLSVGYYIWKSQQGRLKKNGHHAAASALRDLGDDEHRLLEKSGIAMSEEKAAKFAHAGQLLVGSNDVEDEYFDFVNVLAPSGGDEADDDMQVIAGEEEFPPVNEADDDEGWMVVTADDLDAFLLGKMGISSASPSPPPPHNGMNGGGNVRDPGLADGEVANGEKKRNPLGGGGVDQSIADLVSSFEAFFADQTSGLDGAEAPQMDGVSLDAEEFFRILGQPFGAGGRDEDGDDDDDSDDDDEAMADVSWSAGEEKRHSGPSQQDATDRVVPGLAEAERSEIEDDRLFMAQYQQAMEKEMEGYSLKDSFERIQREAAEQLLKTKSVGPIRCGDDLDGGDPATTGTSGFESSRNGDDGDHTTSAPVDVDLNLVTQLLESLQGEEGGPGAASNMLREMGLDLLYQNIVADGATPVSSAHQEQTTFTSSAES